MTLAGTALPPHDVPKVRGKELSGFPRASQAGRSNSDRGFHFEDHEVSLPCCNNDKSHICHWPLLCFLSFCGEVNLASECTEKIIMKVAVEVSPATAAKLQAIAAALHLSVDEYLSKVMEIVPLPVAPGPGAAKRAKTPSDAFDDEENKLVEAGLMRLPAAELTEDFWQMPAPQVPTDAIIAAIQADRDER